MRSVAEIISMVRELAHDRTGKTYGNSMVGYRVRDAYADLLDRIMADPMAAKCLLKEGDATDVADEIDLPSDCGRLLRMERYDTDREEWFSLRTDQQGAIYGSDGYMPRSATFQTMGQTIPDYHPLTWRSAQDGNSVLLWPTGSSGTVRFVYLARPAFPAGDRGVLPLPDGADELVEYLAADKLISLEPVDSKRIQTYAAYFATRFGTWREGAAAGKIDRTQRRVAEVGE